MASQVQPFIMSHVKKQSGDCFSDARRSASVVKAKYGGMEASDVKRLKELEEENRGLKQMYADLSLKSQLQAEIIKSCSACSRA